MHVAPQDACVTCRGSGCGDCGNSGLESEARGHGCRRQRAPLIPATVQETFDRWSGTCDPNEVQRRKEYVAAVARRLTVSEGELWCALMSGLSRVERFS